MRVVFLLGLLSLFSCGQRVIVRDIKMESVGDHIDLLQVEKEISGRFFELRQFHQGLMNEVLQEYKNAAPYDSLDYWFTLEYREADTVALCRIQQQQLKLRLDSLLGDRTRLSKKNHRFAEVQTLLAESCKLRQLALENGLSFTNQYVLYDMSVYAHDIKRISYSEYAEKLNEKVMQWQDSLEQVGRLIAAEKADLKQKFLEQKGDEFFAHYQHTSELEAKLKAFDGSIMQLQNSLSRFEGANQEEYFYIGPHIEIRREVQATESILADLDVTMQDCRLMSVKYWNSYQ